MQIIERSHNDPDYGTADCYEIEVVSDAGNQLGTCSFSCQLDCPEDNNMERNFQDVFNIRSLIQLAYEAGKQGEDLTFAKEEVDW